jgi:hypothetical protein
MKTIILCAVLLFSTGLFAQDAYWSHMYGNDDSQIGRSVIPADDGTVFIAGEFDDTLNFGGVGLQGIGPLDIFVAKLDEDGVPIWLSGIMNSNSIRIKEMDIDANGDVFICGQFQGTQFFGDSEISVADGWDIYVAKIDGASGEWLWAQAAGGLQDDSGEGLAIDTNGNVYITGYFRVEATFGTTVLESYGQTDIFISAYNTDGIHQWAEHAGGESFDAGWGIHIDQSDNMFLCGEFINAADFDTVSVSTGNFSDDMFLARYNINGSPLWVQHNSTMNFSQGYDVKTDNANAVYVAGYYEGTTQFPDTALTTMGPAPFVGRYDIDGNFEWVRAMTCASEATLGRFVSLTYGADDVLYVAGYFNGDMTLEDNEDVLWEDQGSVDGCLFSFSNQGDYRWGAHLGSEAWEAWFEVTNDEDGRLFLAGSGQGDIEAFGIEHENAGDYDILVSKLSPCEFPSLDLSLSWFDICEDETTEVVVDQTESGVNYNLLFDGNEVATEPGNDSELTIGVLGYDLGFGVHSIQMEISKPGCAEDWLLDDTIDLEVFETPEVDFSGVSDNLLTVQFTDETMVEDATIDQWYWQFGDLTDDDVQDPAHTDSSEGMYNVCLTTTTTSDCSAIYCQDVEAIFVGIGELDKEQFFFYPNPAEDLLTIQMSISSLGQIEIIDQQGRIVLSRQLIGSDKLLLDVGDLVPGIYSIRMKGAELTTQRLVIR